MKAILNSLNGKNSLMNENEKLRKQIAGLKGRLEGKDLFIQSLKESNIAFQNEITFMKENLETKIDKFLEENKELSLKCKHNDELLNTLINSTHNEIVKDYERKFKDHVKTLRTTNKI